MGGGFIGRGRRRPERALLPPGLNAAGGILRPEGRLVPLREEKTTVAQADPITVLKGLLRHGDAIHGGRAGGSQILNLELLPRAPADAAMARGYGRIVDREVVRSVAAN